MGGACPAPALGTRQDVLEAGMDEPQLGGCWDTCPSWLARVDGECGYQGHLPVRAGVVDLLQGEQSSVATSQSQQ